MVHLTSTCPLIGVALTLGMHLLLVTFPEMNLLVSHAHTTLGLALKLAEECYQQQHLIFLYSFLKCARDCSKYPS